MSSRRLLLPPHARSHPSGSLARRLSTHPGPFMHACPGSMIRWPTLSRSHGWVVSLVQVPWLRGALCPGPMILVTLPCIPFPSPFCIVSLINVLARPLLKQGVCSHCGLAIYIKNYLKAKEELHKLKYFTIPKSSKNPLIETKILQDIIITLL
jgi:hypothetical protein